MAKKTIISICVLYDPKNHCYKTNSRLAQRHLYRLLEWVLIQENYIDRSNYNENRAYSWNPCNQEFFLKKGQITQLYYPGYQPNGGLL